MAVMVDTNILIHVIGEEPDQVADAVEHAKWKACRELLATEGVILVSAVAWFEVHNIQLDDGTSLGSRLGQVWRNLQVEPLHVDAAEAAAKLIAGATDTCPKCHAHIETKPCAGCGREVGKVLRLNDAMIVGHAEVLPAVTALYTYDENMIKVGKGTRNSLTVVEPPAATGVAINSRKNRLVVADSPEDVADTGDSISIPIPVPLPDDGDPGADGDDESHPD